MPKTGGFHDNLYQFTAEDIRFTQSKDGKTVYAILLGWPGNGAEITIKSLGPQASAWVDSVSMLATGELLNWSRGADGLHVTMPAKAAGEDAYVLRIAGAR
jgi:alpha-L-fucosidase